MPRCPSRSDLCNALKRPALLSMPAQDRAPRQRALDGVDYLRFAEPCDRVGISVEPVLNLLERRQQRLAVVEQLGITALLGAALDEARDHHSVELHVVRTTG